MPRSLEATSYSIAAVPAPVAQAVAWPVEPDRAAILVHDMQSYFVRTLCPKMRGEIVSNIAAILDWARSNDIPVFCTAQPGRMSCEDRGLLADFWGPGMRTSAEDREIIADLAPRKTEIVLTKWRYSAFFKSDLAAMMESRGRDELIITGIYASVGILATAIESFTRDIRPLLVRDAIADFSAERHSSTLDYAAEHCARILSTREVLDNV